MSEKRIYLSPPHQTGLEEEYILEALRSNWIAPLGPHVDAFERDLAGVAHVRAAAALSSGTAALHLSLLLAGVKPGDDVLVSTLTFAGSVFPIRYVGARPVFIDSERRSWNIDPELVALALEEKARSGPVPSAIIVVHLYGQPVNLDPIVEVCDRFGVILIEDAAEALGSTYRGEPVGKFGRMGVYSFNGNKILTTSGGGALLSDDVQLIERARFLASQAREPRPYYQHDEIGYNYRMSNLLAGLGSAQLSTLDQRVRKRRDNFSFYQEALGDLPGFEFMPEAPWGTHNRWLTTVLVDREVAGTDPERLREGLEAADIEARPLWKPMHLQPVFAEFERFGGAVSEELFRDGLCLPSGSDLTDADLARVVGAIRRLVGS